MRHREIGVLVVLAACAGWVPEALACHHCKRTPCVVQAQPAYQCVTEMVPYTVMKRQVRIEYDTVEQTVMVRQPVTNYVERQRVVCKPVYDTVEVPRQRIVTRPIHETEYVTQTYTECRPVQSTQQVTTYCMQPTTQMVPVRTGHKCGLHGKSGCGCTMVAQTCYVPVPVVKDVVVTQMVPEVKTRQVPVHRTRYVQEVVTETQRITRCRMVQEVVTERVPHVTWTCVPKTVTRRIPRRVCEMVPVTCYKPVRRLVPVMPASYVEAAPAPSMQAVPSMQASPQGVPTGQTAAPTKQG